MLLLNALDYMPRRLSKLSIKSIGAQLNSEVMLMSMTTLPANAKPEKRTTQTTEPRLNILPRIIFFAGLQILHEQEMCGVTVRIKFRRYIEIILRELYEVNFYSDLPPVEKSHAEVSEIFLRQYLSATLTQIGRFFRDRGRLLICTQGRPFEHFR